MSNIKDVRYYFMLILILYRNPKFSSNSEGHFLPKFSEFLVFVFIVIFHHDNCITALFDDSPERSPSAFFS